MLLFLLFSIPLLVVKSIRFYNKGGESVYSPYKGPLYAWKITHHDTTSYIYGTLHCGKKSWYPLPPPLEEALVNSKKLVVELDIYKRISGRYILWPFSSIRDAVQVLAYPAILGYRAGRGMQKLLSLPLLHATRTERLYDMLSPEAYATLQAYMKENGCSWIDRQLLPFVQEKRAIALLNSLMMMKIIGLPADGVDYYLLQVSKKVGKPIIALEDFQFQQQMFAKLSFREGYGLEAQINDIPKQEQRLQKFVKAWKQGDMDRYYQDAVYAQEAYVPGFEQAVIVDRNATMLAKIILLLQQEEPIFVAVGASHLPGEKGLIKGLQEAGYQVAQMVA